jgi:hypothetical protein
MSPADFENIIERVNKVPGRTQKLEKILFLKDEQFIGGIESSTP